MFRSEKYLTFVRNHPCIALHCPARAEVAHHFARSKGGGGTGLKVHDTFTVPLCDAHHRAVHQHGQLPYLSAEETEAHFSRVALMLVTGWILRQEEKKQS